MSEGCLNPEYIGVSVLDPKRTCEICASGTSIKHLYGIGSMFASDIDYVRGSPSL